MVSRASATNFCISRSDWRWCNRTYASRRSTRQAWPPNKSLPADIRAAQSRCGHCQALVRPAPAGMMGDIKAFSRFARGQHRMAGLCTRLCNRQPARRNRAVAASKDWAGRLCRTPPRSTGSPETRADIPYARVVGKVNHGDTRDRRTPGSAQATAHGCSCAYGGMQQLRSGRLTISAPAVARFQALSWWACVGQPDGCG